MSKASRILIVDDEPRMCESLKTLLSNPIYEIETSLSGNEAIAALKQNYFDLVILDMFLTDISGQEVMEFIHEQNQNTMVIVVTGYASIESTIKAIKSGVVFDYLKKPFDLEELLKAVENALTQKRLKRENTDINTKLEQSEERYRYIVQNSSDLIYTLDDDGKFSFVNSTFEEKLGYTTQELIGKHYTSVVSEKDLEIAKYFFNERRTGNRANMSKEFRLKPKQNRKNIGASSVSAITIDLDSEGIYDKDSSEKQKNFLGTYGVARDITVRKQLEGRLQQSQKMEALGRLAGGIAHDFNNILTGILGYTSLMLLDLDDEHSHYKELKTIESQVESGAELVKQLLGFAKKGKSDQKLIDLNELVKKVSEMFGRTKKEITITRDLQQNAWCVEANRIQVEQMLLNLFVNAWQAMPEGGKIRIKIRNECINESDQFQLFQLKPGNYVMISVSDTGLGMDDDTRRRIFDPFFTTKGKIRGTGLGLTTVYSIVKNHGGNINVFSQQGKGTRFNIYLPASKIEYIKVKEEQVETFSATGNETILLVDDEKIIVDIGQKILKSLGYKVLVAESAKEAIDIYMENRELISLIILDMIMPNTGGKEAYLILREINPNIKVLFSSGYDINGEATELLSYGCNGFLQKPFSIKELSKKLREVLDEKQQVSNPISY